MSTAESSESLYPLFNEKVKAQMELKEFAKDTAEMEKLEAERELAEKE